MTQTPIRIAAVGLAVLLIIAVGYGIVSSARDAIGPGAVSLHGLIGSEKDPFFKDPRVATALKRGGFRGSRSVGSGWTAPEHRAETEISP